MDGPSPKIRDRSQPEASDAEKQAEVEQHNREFEQRYDRGPPAPEDAVDKRYWSGEFEEPRSRRLLITFTRSRMDKGLTIACIAFNTISTWPVWFDRLKMWHPLLVLW